MRQPITMEYCIAKMNGNRSRLERSKGIKRDKQVSKRIKGDKESAMMIIITAMKYEIRKLSRDYCKN